MECIVKLPQINRALFLSPFLLGVYCYGLKVESRSVGSKRQSKSVLA